VDEIISMMVGRSLSALYPPQSSHIGDIVFSCRNLSRFGAVRDVSFDLRKGEILGIAGLIGSGRTEAMRALVGADPRLSGDFTLDGTPVALRSPAEALAAGVVYVSEDRKGHGLFLDYDMTSNISASVLSKGARAGMINRAQMRKRATDYIAEMDIRPARPATRTVDLSGGNQQKVLLSKALATSPKVLIVDEPTRGVDVGAKALIHKRLRDLAESGVGVIVVSSELPEVLGMADRLLVFREGSVAVQRDNTNSSLTPETVMAAAVN
jgi:ABC-type sugar transport system ATPase subunit